MTRQSTRGGLFRFVRIATGFSGLTTAANLALGRMDDPAFIVPDLVAAALLMAGAIIPARRLSAIAMAIANAFALGVFSVAAAGPIAQGGSPGIGVWVAIGASVVCLILLASTVKGGEPQ